MTDSLPRIRFFHWKAANSDEKALLLKLAGYEVDDSSFNELETVKTLRRDPPKALVIDLSRQPSSGRDVGILIRTHPSTRLVPLLFIDGSGPIVESLKQLLPDAIFTDWDSISQMLQAAVLNPPESVIVPDSVFAPYRDVPLAKKLGITPASRVLLLFAPPGIEETLKDILSGTTLTREAAPPPSLTLAFFKSLEELERSVGSLIPYAEKGGLWILNPKKKTGQASGLTQNDVRRTGLSAGLVDFKVCSFDDTWTGLRFTRKGAK
jgi:hypothetical protein